MILNSRSIAVQSLLFLAFLMLSGCSKGDQVDGQATAQVTTQATTQANSTVQPSQIPKPLVTSQAVSTNLEASKLKNLKLQPVPPNGFDQLNEIGLKYNSDKSSIYHCYLDLYDKHFSEYRHKEINFLEIGILFGDSLNIFNEYFKSAKITALDIENKSHLKKDNINILFKLK
jgi:GTPase SAR1 family protein